MIGVEDSKCLIALRGKARTRPVSRQHNPIDLSGTSQMVIRRTMPQESKCGWQFANSKRYFSTDEDARRRHAFFHARRPLAEVGFKSIVS